MDDMTPERRHEVREGLALNAALRAGDMPTFFALLADYMNARGLKMPEESVALFADRGLMSSTA